MERPIVPADIVPIMSDIIAVMSAIFGIPGIEGIEPGLGIEPLIVPGLMVPGFGMLPMFPKAPSFAIDEEVKSRNLLPEAVSHSESWSMLAMVASVLPSALKPASLALDPSIKERNSRPDFTSQSFA